MALIDLSARPGSISSSSVLKGSAPNFTGYPSNQIQDIGEIGIKVSQNYSWDVAGFELANFMGTGLDYSGTQNWQDVGSAFRVRAHDCYRGFYMHPVQIGGTGPWLGGDNATFSSCFAWNCIYGFHNDAANNKFVGCNAIYCDTAFKVSNLVSGANHGHGNAVACSFEHSTYNLVCSGVNLGYAFTGCNFIAGQGGTDQGIIQINDSRGISILEILLVLQRFLELQSPMALATAA